MAGEKFKEVTSRAYARAGLLGNPSDGYGGKAVAVSVYDFEAQVKIRPAANLCIAAAPETSIAFTSMRELEPFYRDVTCDGGARLLGAAIACFNAFAGLPATLDVEDPRLRFSIGFETTIPRQVGLSGSSAIVIAALRGLSSWFEVEIEKFDLAELALRAEVAELGIAAGPMDRVIQSYEGLWLMDFREPRSGQGYRQLDPACLPEFFIAWVPAGAESSDKIHGDLRARWLAGDRQVLEVVASLRKLVEQGVVCLARADHKGFRTIVDRNFELRTRICDVSEQDHEMIEIARSFGAAAKLCGSGGAVLCVPRSAGEFERIEAAYLARGYSCIDPLRAPSRSERK